MEKTIPEKKSCEIKVYVFAIFLFDMTTHIYDLFSEARLWETYQPEV